MLTLRQQREHKGWWLGPGWTETDTRCKWGIMSIEAWNALTPIDRAYNMAYCNALSTMQAWESLDRKERARLVWEYRQRASKS